MFNHQRTMDYLEKIKRINVDWMKIKVSLSARLHVSEHPSLNRDRQHLLLSLLLRHWGIWVINTVNSIELFEPFPIGSKNKVPIWNSCVDEPSKPMPKRTSRNAMSVHPSSHFRLFWRLSVQDMQYKLATKQHVLTSLRRSAGRWTTGLVDPEGSFSELRHLLDRLAPAIVVLFLFLWK